MIVVLFDEDSIRPQVSKIMYVISVAATIGVILAIYFLYRRKIYGKIILLFSHI